MTEPKVWVFFYGSYMNFGVLREVDLVPEQWEVGQLNGFDIRIRPRANLIRSDRDSVYGIAATATHAEHGKALVCIGCVEAAPDGPEHRMVVGGRWGYIDHQGHEIVSVTHSREEIMKMERNK